MSFDRYFRLLVAAGRFAHVDGRQPAIFVRQFAAGDPEELFLDRFGDRAARAAAHLDLVHRPDRRDFRRRAGEEDLIRQMYSMSREIDLFADFVAEFAGRWS